MPKSSPSAPPARPCNPNACPIATSGSRSNPAQPARAPSPQPASAPAEVAPEPAPDPEPVADTPTDPAAAILGRGADPSDSDLRRVNETLDRAHLVLVQTPQVFERNLLIRAYAQNVLSSTDDAGLVERLGETVITTPGDPANIKITRPGDVPVARALGGFKPPAERASHKKF